MEVPSGYKNDSGEDFKGESWISALPTDSQVIFILIKIISSIFIKYLDEGLNEEHEKASLLLTYPLTPKIEKNSNTLLFYQISPNGVQPHFNIFFQEKIYKCKVGTDNFFNSAVVFMYIFKTKLTSKMRKSKLRDFINLIINY